MGNRRLYGEKKFLVEGVREIISNENVSYLFGRFSDGSIKSKRPQRQYKIRVASDPRWRSVTNIFFHADAIKQFGAEGLSFAPFFYFSG